MIDSMTEATIAIGMSLLTVVRWMVMGATIAATPTMSNTLKMLLPTMFPMARSGVPFMADTMETKNSGIDVPIATIVRPMTICGIPSFVAKPTAPFVSQSALFNTTTMPKIKSSICAHTVSGAKENNSVSMKNIVNARISYMLNASFSSFALSSPALLFLMASTILQSLSKLWLMMRGCISFTILMTPFIIGYVNW